MKSPFYFITRAYNGRRYDNVKSIGGIDFITSTSEEDHKASNRYAEVIETPLGYEGPIRSGDTLLVHHNVFKFYNDMKGRQQSGKSFFKDDLFFIDEEQFFMYKQGGEWHSYDLVGIMKYPNDYLKSKGISSGDMVCFKPESEYEFDVDGEKLYRMYDHQITIKM